MKVFLRKKHETMNAIAVRPMFKSMCWLEVIQLKLRITKRKLQLNFSIAKQESAKKGVMI